jgi:hypothetical protein
MGTNRNALYKLMHDARLRLKHRLEQEGPTINELLAMFNGEDFDPSMRLKMPMKNFFDLFKRHPKKAKDPDQGMQMLLSSVSMTGEKELSCDEVFVLLDQFAEMAKRGEDAAQLRPMVASHLHMCPDCRVEYEALLKMIEDSSVNEDRRS